MRVTGWPLLALVLGLAACDDPDGTVVTHTFRESGYAPSVFTAGGGVAVEVHGTPFAGWAEDEIVAAIALPQSLPAGLRARPVTPGSSGIGSPARIVLVFGAAEGLGPRETCATRDPLPGAAPQAVGYTVWAVVCSEARVLATGRMRATRVQAGDGVALTRSLRHLFTVMGLGPQRQDR